jgi:hypothetical protein
MTASITPFLAPPTGEEETIAPRVSDRDEVAMRRLRHPFAVAAGATPHRKAATTATIA